jgi:hypothetical protein
MAMKFLLLVLFLLLPGLGAADAFWQTPLPAAAPNTAPVGKTGAAFLTGYTLNPLEDGFLRTGVAWPRPRFRNNNNGTITDNATGLVWLQNANAFGTRTWAQALDDCAALASGAAGLTDGSTAGQWRLPNCKELLSLGDCGRGAPGLPSGQPFSSVQSNAYWSSTSYASNTASAWYMYGLGALYFAVKTTTAYYVWPVRAGPVGSEPTPVPATGAGDLGGYVEDVREDGTTKLGVVWPNPRFTDNLNGTVTDNLTKLVWLKSANAFGGRAWATALADCASLASGQAGLTDGSTAGQWRLPSVRELESLVCPGYASPALPNTAGTAKWTEGNPFSSVQQSNRYWSSTSLAGATGSAWFVSFGVGDVGAGGKINTYYVWPVRGGP